MLSGFLMSVKRYTMKYIAFIATDAVFITIVDLSCDVTIYSLLALQNRSFLFSLNLHNFHYCAQLVDNSNTCPQMSSRLPQL